MPDYSYPRRGELRRIENWDLLAEDVRGLLDYIRSLWWMPEWGYILRGKRVLRLELHTGGWSENEDIIGALQSNILFWPLCWEKSTAGGHYWFRIRLAQFRGKVRTCGQR